MTRTSFFRLAVALSLALCLCLPALAQALPFPAGATSAKVGDTLLGPNQDKEKITANQTVIYYTYQMVAPGATESKIKDPFKERTVPNALLITIPPGQTAKVGDVVLSWWQSGSGMQRALVMDAKDPKQPVVRYLDIDYDNPAKGKGGVGIGQMDEQLKPDSFVGLTKEYAPGTAVAVVEEGGKKLVHAQVVNVVGDQVILLGFAGRMSIRPKSKCMALPILPKVKAGDELYVPFTDAFTKVTAKRVDAKIGRVFVDMYGREKAIAFGNVLNPVEMAQAYLTRLGLKPGPVNGAMGKETDAAIRAFQKGAKLPEDGKATIELVQALFAKVK